MTMSTTIDDRKLKTNQHNEGTDQLALWTLRTLLRTSVSRRLKELIEDTDVLYAAGVSPEWAAVIRKGTDNRDDEKEDAPEARLRRALEVRLALVERHGVSRNEPLFENVGALSDAVGLSRLEQEFLAYAVMAENERGLGECWDKLPHVHYRRLARDLAAVLDTTLPEMKKCLRSDAPLIATGLLIPQVYQYDGPFEICNGLDDFLFQEIVGDRGVLGFFFEQGKRSTLTVADYPHLGRDPTLIAQYLERATAKKLTGINILLWGVPGTGKTEFARALAEQIGLELFEINVVDWEGDPMSGRERLSSYLTSQRILSHRPDALILFDEIEDLFSEAWGQKPLDNPHFLKGRFNRILETNPVPAIWISNAIEQLDRAFLRRFDFIVELPVPPKGVRRNILTRRLGRAAEDGHWLERIAANETLTPADVDRAARVISATDAGEADDARQVAEQVISSALSVRGERLPPAEPAAELPFDPQLVNTDCDIDGLIAALEARSKGNICLYGPPGTGKTGLARYLASRCGLELTLFRASDLLRAYVGQTEERIARMFAQAAPGRELLLLDEADSFFRDRRRARHNWEVTQVNELLVQMEAYEGLFIAATNLVERFDQAAFRRFALKIKFEYLRDDQLPKMFDRTAETLGLDLDQSTRPAVERQLIAIRRLTPGDFRAVEKRFGLLGQRPAVDQILDALAQEVAHKPRADRAAPIGFGRRPDDRSNVLKEPPGAAPTNRTWELS